MTDVEEYFENERKLAEEYGSSIIFQVYRINPQSTTLKELQGKLLAEFKLDGKLVRGDETVAAVKKRARALLLKDEPQLEIQDDDQISFYLSGRPMRDGSLFYADNYILLPVWVQLVLHRCDLDHVKELINTLPQG